MKIICGILVETSKGKTPLKEFDSKNLSWTHLAQDIAQWQDVVNTVINLHILHK
jgi:hypothetical protein